MTELEEIYLRAQIDLPADYAEHRKRAIEQQESLIFRGDPDGVISSVLRYRAFVQDKLDLAQSNLAALPKPVDRRSRGWSLGSRQSVLEAHVAYLRGAAQAATTEKIWADRRLSPLDMTDSLAEHQAKVGRARAELTLEAADLARKGWPFQMKGKLWIRAMESYERAWEIKFYRCYRQLKLARAGEVPTREVQEEMDFLAGLQDLAADDYTWAFSRACKLDGWLPNQDERHEAQTLLAAV